MSESHPQGGKYGKSCFFLQSLREEALLQQQRIREKLPRLLPEEPDLPVGNRLRESDKRRLRGMFRYNQNFPGGCVKKKEKTLVRELWVCDYPGCGVAYCCKIPRLHPSYVFWCDNPCKFIQTDNCTQLRGYSGDPNDPYKEKIVPGQVPPFVIKKGRCLDHYEK